MRMLCALCFAIVAMLWWGSPLPARADVTGEYDLVQLVVEFPPGTWTPAHMHGGPILVTVLESELTVRDNQGVEKSYKAGESFVEQAGVFLEVGNHSNAKVRVTAAALLPKGAALTTNKDGTTTPNAPPGPTTVYRNQTPVGNLHGDYDVVQLVLDFAPGAWTPSHMHGGLVLVTVLDSQTTVRNSSGEKTYKAGESFVETAGTYLVAGNGGATPARNAAIALLPKGATLTTTEAGLNTQGLPPGPTTVFRSQMTPSGVTLLPQTGADTRGDNAWLVLGGVGLLLLATGAIARRRNAH